MDIIGSVFEVLAQAAAAGGQLVDFLLRPHVLAWLCGVSIAIGLTQTIKRAPFMQRRESEARRKARAWWLRAFAFVIGAAVSGILWPANLSGWRGLVEHVAVGSVCGASSFVVYDLWRNVVLPLLGAAMNKIGASRFKPGAGKGQP